MPACTNCSTGKRKCSKELPSCERCIKLNKECVYPSMKPKFMLLESKISNIETTYENIKDKFKNIGNNGIYNRLCEKFFTNFGASIPFIRYEKIQSLLLTPCHDSALINAICVQPYQLELRDTFEKPKKFPLEDNPFYQKAERLLSSLLEDFSLETIQALVLMAFFECGAGFLTKSSMHLAQAVKKAQVLNLDKSEFKRLTPDSDLQAEYIATWSVCHLIDILASSFFYCPKITNSVHEEEGIQKDVDRGSFCLPTFNGTDDIYFSENLCEDLSSYVDDIIKGLGLQFKHQSSKLLLSTIAYKKASLLSHLCFVYNKKLISKDITSEQFSKYFLKLMNLFYKLIPKNITSKYLQSLSSINDTYIYLCCSQWFTLKLFPIYLARLFRANFTDSKIIDSMINSTLCEVFTALNHEDEAFWWPLHNDTFFICSFGNITVLYFFQNPEYKVDLYQKIALKYIYTGLAIWPALLYILGNRFKGGFKEMYAFFNGIGAPEIAQTYFN